MFFELSCFHYFLAFLFFYQTYSWIHLVFDFQPITLHHGYQKTRVCFVSWVVYFRFIHLLCGTILITQALNYWQSISVCQFPFSHQTSFPMFSENNIFYLFIVLFSPVPPCICVQSRQLYNHAFYQLIIFSLTNSAPVKHLIIYAGGIYRDPPHPDFCLLSLYVWKFLAFSFKDMHVCSFWVEGKKKKR